jgi:poly(3-hydroxybutyrate) depolymerase
VAGDDCDVSLTVYENRGEEGSAPVFAYVVQGGGHSVPSSANREPENRPARRLTGPACRSVEGVDLAWDFFQRF